MEMTKKAWFLVGCTVLAGSSGVYQLATANRRAHMEQVAQAMQRADVRIAKDQAAQDRRLAQAAKPVAPKAPNAVDVAFELCAKLRQAGASTCVPHFNFWSSSYIDATVPMNPQAASLLCQAAAAVAANPVRVLAGLQLKLFSPFGAERPMVVCDL